ncbi:MAG: prolipoprotein diacylglyceryl transferase family protein [Bacteroidota bacterium]
MHPVLFEIGSITIYTYGFLIALGCIAAFTYMWRASKITFDQANSLFILLIIAGIVGGKLFMLFEDPSTQLLSTGGFVFYGSLLFCIPTMLIFFRRNKLPVLSMLDIMAIVTCIVHCFGRLGCFMAGCCYGLPTDSALGVIFTDPACQGATIEHTNPSYTTLRGNVHPPVVDLPVDPETPEDIRWSGVSRVPDSLCLRTWHHRIVPW